MRILFTSDVHGRAGVTDPLTGDPAPGGLARVGSLLEARRRDVPDAFYLDLGDLVQGTPMSTLAIRERPDEPHPLVRVLNRLGCHGLVVGNHEFNFGLPWLERFRRDADFPLLAANVIGPDGRPFLEPVLRLENRGRRVAVLALTSPQVPRWEEPWNIEGLEFRDAVETAREWVPELRREADAVVVAAHMGWEGVTDGGLEMPDPPENDVGRLLAEVEGIDAVLMAHTHRSGERRVNGALAVQADWGGRALGELDFEWEDGVADSAPRPQTTFRLHRALDATPASPVVLAEVRDAEERAAARIAEPIGNAAAPFPLGRVRWEDNAILTLLHKVHLDTFAADLSSAALFRARETLPAGPIRRLDTYRIYPFENDLTILELTVDCVRAYLEEIALAWTGPAVDGTLPPLHPDISLYNHDSLAGCEYEIDPSRPAGRRITALTFRGEERPGSARLSLALTSYRAQGGGGLPGAAGSAGRRAHGEGPARSPGELHPAPRPARAGDLRELAAGRRAGLTFCDNCRIVLRQLSRMERVPREDP